MQVVLKIADRARDNGRPTVHLEVLVAGIMEPCLYELFQGGVQIEASDAGRFTVRAPSTYNVIVRDAIGKVWRSNTVNVSEGWFA